MRDIKPMGTLPKKLYSKPRFTGSEVPVAATPVVTEMDSPVVAKQPLKSSVRLGDKERKLIAVLLVLVIAVLGLAAFLFLPKAKITLTLQTAPLLLDQELKLKNVKAAEPGVIPGQMYVRDVSVQGAAAVTSREVIGHKAAGTARIVNKTIDEQKIKEKSRLVTTDGTLFYMQTHAIVPPNGSVTIPIEAAQAGEGGNLKPQRLNFAALDKSAQSLVYAEVETAISGGSGEEVAVVKDDDLKQASQQAGSEARTQVEQEIRSQLDRGWILLDESWTGQLRQFDTEAKAGDKRDSIPYKAQVTVRVFAYEEMALQQALQQALASRLDENHMLFPEPISFTKSVKDINWDNEEATITVRATHTTIPSFSINTLREKLAGRGKAEAIAYLEGLPGVKSATIELGPFWATGIPRIEKRVSIDLVPDRQP